jgi:glucokinase
LQLVVGTQEAAVLDRRRFSVDSRRGAEGIRESIASALPELVDQWRPAAIGVGYGGPVNWRTGQIVKSYHLLGWNDFALADWLNSLSGIPAFVDNDGNVAALGEALHGVGRGCDPVFYVTIGSGVGGGLVTEGRIFHGFTPGESEIGHLRLDRIGTITEDLCSGWSLNRRVQEAVREEPEGVLARGVASAPGNEARHLGPALAAGDALAGRIVEEATRNLAYALSHVVHLFHPEIIVLGGGVSLLGEPWRSGVARHLEDFVMDAFHPVPRVELAALREDAVPVGALALAAQRSSSVPRIADV